MTTHTHETRGTLHDATLDAEIQLVGDLVVAATVSDGPLSQQEIDEALGVTDAAIAPGQDERPGSRSRSS